VGVSRAGMGEWDSAAQLFDDARRVTEGLGDRRRWADAVGNLALVHLFRGDVAEATRQLVVLLESAARERDRRYQVGALRPLVWCLIAEGRIEEAAARLDQLRIFLDEGLEAEVEATRQDVHGFSACLAQLRGDEAGARREIDAILPQLERVDPSSSFYSTFLSASAIADAVHLLWSETRARGAVVDAGLLRASEVSCRVLAKYAKVFPVAKAASLRARAARTHLLGKSVAGDRLLSESRVAAAALQMVDRPLAKPSAEPHVHAAPQ
jgi:hypothetical protein